MKRIPLACIAALLLALALSSPEPAAAGPGPDLCDCCHDGSLSPCSTCAILECPVQT